VLSFLGVKSSLSENLFRAYIVCADRYLLLYIIRRALMGEKEKEKGVYIYVNRRVLMTNNDSY